MKGATKESEKKFTQNKISIHAPREGSDKISRKSKKLFADFNPRSPWRERHNASQTTWDVNNISIHAPREGSDSKEVRIATDWHISIHAPREGSDIFWIHSVFIFIISIHAPREGSDGKWCYTICKGFISIHAPREGSDVFKVGQQEQTSTFQSTLPVKGATRKNKYLDTYYYNFNPRSPWRERQQCWLIFLLQSFNFLLILLIFLYNYKSITLSISYST